MAGETETMKIHDDKGGYIVINKSDYDEKEHKEYEEQLQEEKLDEELDKKMEEEQPLQTKKRTKKVNK